MKAESLLKKPVPCLLGDTAGSFVVLIKIDESKALVLDRAKDQPEQRDPEVLNERYSGELILYKHKDMVISPGMTAQAEVETGIRRIIEFFTLGME